MYAERIRGERTRETEVPKEIQALERKIARRQEHQRAGDADMTFEELPSVIDRAHVERRKLEDAQPGAREGARIVAMLPNAADLYRKQIHLGLDGEPRALLKGRVVLRKLRHDRAR